MHGIVLGLPISERLMVYDTWNKGRIDISPISHADVRYTLEYIDKQVYGASKLYEVFGDFQPPFAHFSKGLGFKWVENNLNKFDEFGTIHFTDTKSYTLPPYLRDKFRFKNKYEIIPESINKFAKEQGIKIDNAKKLYQVIKKRGELKERQLQHKELRFSGSLYDVDHIEKLKLENQ